MNRSSRSSSARPILAHANRPTTIDPARVLAEFEYQHPVFDARRDPRAAAPARDPGRPRHLLRRRLLGLRLPRGRRAERASRSRDRESPMTCSRDERGRDLRRHRVRHRRLDTRRRASSRRGCSSPTSTSTRSRVRSTVCRVGRRAARRRSRFRRDDFFDGADRPARRRRPRPRRGAARPPPDGPVHLLAQLRTFGWLFNPLAVYYCWTADGRDARRGRARGHEHAVGRTALVRVRRAHATPTARPPPRRCTCRRSCRWTSTTDVSWTAPGDALTSTSWCDARATTVFAADLALRRTALDRRHAVDGLAALPAAAAAGLARDLPRRPWRLFLARVPVYRHPSRPVQEVGA